MTTATLYHGTPAYIAKDIIKDGFLLAPVYLTPNKETAEDYAANNSSDYVVFEVEVEYSALDYDDEFVSSHSVEESLDNGSVVVRSNISIKGAELTRYEDYCEV